MGGWLKGLLRLGGGGDPSGDGAWRAEVVRGDTPGVRYTLFCLGPLSNWSASPFRLDGRRFESLEQYLMWRKAVLFGDGRTADRILAARHAAEAKALGRAVAGFDPLVWYCAAKGILFRGAYRGKYAQHPPSRAALLATAGTVLVEASNSDRVWSIGLAEYEPQAWDAAEWRGTNWLGEILTRTREAILADMRKQRAVGAPATAALKPSSEK